MRQSARSQICDCSYEHIDAEDGGNDVEAAISVQWQRHDDDDEIDKCQRPHDEPDEVAEGEIVVNGVVEAHPVEIDEMG